MKTIWKFDVRLEGESVVRMPVGATILSVQEQHGAVRVWAAVDEEAPTENRYILIRGTGHSLPDFDVDHLGTFQMEGGNFVFHAFERAKDQTGERK